MLPWGTALLARLTDRGPLARLEKALEQAREEALAADRLKQAFLRGVPHEIRSPIAVISGYVQLLRDLSAGMHGAEAEQVGAFCDGIEASCQRLRRTLDLVLHTSLLRSGSSELRLAPVRLGTLLADLIGKYESPARARGLSMAFHPETDADTVWADEHTTTSLFEQLLDNAVKFTRAGGVEVSVLRSDPEAVTVSVRDTGVGMSAGYLEALFGLFTQEDDQPTRQYEGSGLGLALVKHCADLNRARIQVESRKGQGTRFLVTFPAVGGTAPVGLGRAPSS